ncbi:MAG: TonB C-terminal domain-containing protein [Lentisphaerae bacterium]|nr:TonB C-terminal domain-containing protein [Lentisphaerota bacterium]
MAATLHPVSLSLKLAPFTRRCLVSAIAHILVIVAVLVVSDISFRFHRPLKEISLFDITSVTPGPAGGAAAGDKSAPVVPATPKIPKNDVMPVPGPKPPKQPPKTPPSDTRPKPPSADDIRKILGKGIENVGSPILGAGGGMGDPSPYAYYIGLINARLKEAWRKPGSLSTSAGYVTSVFIRIQRDGRLIEKKMIKPSGNTLMDESVMDAVESVKQADPLPANFRNPVMEITINFELTPLSGD